MLRAPLSTIWFTSVAAVISSLGNIAIQFDNVYPSPRFKLGEPSETHLILARALVSRREQAHLDADAQLDEDSFVLRRAYPKGNCFRKEEAEQKRYLHREPAINEFYGKLMNIDDGDTVIQVGNVSLARLAMFSLQKSFGIKRSAL